VYEPASELVVLTAVKSSQDPESTKVNQIGKAEPSDFVTTCESVIEGYWAADEIVNLADENLRGEPKIV
jgi:hypothetical protein